MEAGHWIILAVIVAITFVSSRFLRKRLFDGGPNMAQRRWEWVQVPISIVWVLSLMYVEDFLSRDGRSDRLLLHLCIAITALSGLAVLWWTYHWLRKADEMIRRIETEAMALALGLGMVCFIAVGELHRDGVFPLGNSSSEIGQLMPFFVAYGVARIIIYLKYR